MQDEKYIPIGVQSFEAMMTDNYICWYNSLYSWVEKKM